MDESFPHDRGIDFSAWIAQRREDDRIMSGEQREIGIGALVQGRESDVICPDQGAVVRHTGLGEPEAEWHPVTGQRAPVIERVTTVQQPA